MQWTSRFTEWAVLMAVVQLCGVWSASFNGKITKIESSNNRICEVLITCDGSTILMINCYKPLDNYTEAENYTATLNTNSQLLYTHNSSHVIIGGHRNVDFNSQLY